MTRLGTAAVATAVTLAVSGAVAAESSAATRAQKRCAHAGTTLKADSKARVYQRVVKTGEYDEPRTYGCWRRTGLRTRLDLVCDPDDGSPEGDDACRDDPAKIALRGRWVALEFGGFYDGEGGDTYTTIVRANLKRGRIRLHWARMAARLPNHGGGELWPYLVKLFISRHGGIAYSARGVVEEPGEDPISMIGYVHPPKRGANSAYNEWLDSGEDVSAASLRIDRPHRRITWRTGGVAKHAPWR